MIEMLILFLIAILCEFIDSYLGMMYGTILSPVLIIYGYNPFVVVPSILFSQATGGVIASYRHHKFKNADFSYKSIDFKITSVIIVFGTLASIIGVVTAVNVSKRFLNMYIGVLCIVMGLIVVWRRKFKFSWLKITILGIISSFNKALSGGGFGPIIASGQIISGRKSKESIGTTDFAEAPICLISFLLWVILNKKFPNLNLLLPITFGAMIGGFYGPKALSKFKSENLLKVLVGILAMGLGIWIIIKVL